MSQQLSFGEQAEAALAEATENMVDSAAVNADLTWIPNVGIVLVALALASTIAVLWLSPSATFRTKVTRTLSSLAWSAISITLLIVLSSFSSTSSVPGASPLFIASSVCAAFMGVSSLISRTRNMISADDASPSSPSVSESVPNSSSFWGPVVKTTVQVTLDDDADGAPVSTTHTVSSSVPSPPALSSSASRFPHPTKTLRELKSTGGWRAVAFRAFSEVAGWLIPVLAIAGVSVLSFIFLEMPSNSSFISIPETYMACEFSVIACAVAGSWFIFQRRPIGFIVPLLVSAFYGIAEYFVESFKACAIMPSDLRSANTGMSVAGGYEYELTSEILVIIVLFCLAAGAIAWLRDPLSRFLSRKEYMVGERWKGKFLSRIAAKKQRKEDITCLMKNVVVSVVSVILGVQLAIAPIAPAMEIDWEEEGVVFDYWQTHTSIDNYGIIPSFIAALQLEDIDAPEGYNRESAEQLQSSMASLYDRYIASSQGYIDASSQFDSVKPNVILVMNESFADMSYLGGLGVGYEGLPYVRELDAIGKGKTSVSVYGGGTCNSEFESLTGTSLGYIGGGISPYALYDLSHVDSIPKQFKALGYDTTGIHPEVATNWGRDRVYPELGFDEFIDMDSFADADRLREHVRDFETYDMAIEKIVSSDAPQFIFDLTMSNHGGYETGLIPEADSVDYGFEEAGVLDSFGDSVANEYLSSVRMSDRDAQHLIYKLSEIDEPTVVVFFGDHHPGFSWWFQEGFADRSSDIAYQESMYQTDWFVWANYPVSGSAWSPQTAASESMKTTRVDETVALLVNEGQEATQGQEPTQDLDVNASLEENDGNVNEEELAEENTPGIDWTSVLGPIDIFTRQALGIDNTGEAAEEEQPLTAAQLAEPEDDWYPDLGGGSVLYTGTMSSANLMGWTMTFIGAPLTDYEKASYMSRFWLQSNNIYGYMDAIGVWHPIEQAQQYAGSGIYEEGMQIIDEASTVGLPTGDVLVSSDDTEVISYNEETGEPIGAVESETDMVGDGTEKGASSSDAKQVRERQDAIMFNVMEWITYMNFAEMLR